MSVTINHIILPNRHDLTSILRQLQSFKWSAGDLCFYTNDKSDNAASLIVKHGSLYIGKKEERFILNSDDLRHGFVYCS